MSLKAFESFRKKCQDTINSVRNSVGDSVMEGVFRSHTLNMNSEQEIGQFIADLQDKPLVKGIEYLAKKLGLPNGVHAYYSLGYTRKEIVAKKSEAQVLIERIISHILRMDSLAQKGGFQKKHNNEVKIHPQQFIQEAVQRLEYLILERPLQEVQKGYSDLLTQCNTHYFKNYFYKTQSTAALESVLKLYFPILFEDTKQNKEHTKPKQTQIKKSSKQQKIKKIARPAKDSKSIETKKLVVEEPDGEVNPNTLITDRNTPVQIKTELVDAQPAQYSANEPLQSKQSPHLKEFLLSLKQEEDDRTNYINSRFYKIIPGLRTLLSDNLILLKPNKILISHSKNWSFKDRNVFSEVVDDSNNVDTFFKFLIAVHEKIKTFDTSSAISVEKVKDDFRLYRLVFVLNQQDLGYDLQRPIGYTAEGEPCTYICVVYMHPALHDKRLTPLVSIYPVEDNFLA